MGAALSQKPVLVLGASGGQGGAVTAAAEAARLPFLVFSSVAGATAHTGVPRFESKAVVEQRLAASEIPHTIVAPTYFYDNFLRGDGYQADIDGLRRDYPDVGWTSFAEWARRTFA